MHVSVLFEQNQIPEGERLTEDSQHNRREVRKQSSQLRCQIAAPRGDSTLIIGDGDGFRAASALKTAELKGYPGADPVEGGSLKNAGKI